MTPEHGKRAQAAARLSLGAGTGILLLKYAAFLVTGSVALYSDALESIVNVLAAAASWYAIRVSVAPPDEDHPFGHSKAEYFSAVFEGGLIMVAAVAIITAAWERVRDPVALQSIGLGMGLAVVASVGNALLAAHLVRTGRALDSPALVADGMHIWTDVVTTAGVLGGIGLASATGWWLLDPLVAIFLAVNIVRVGVGLVRGAMGGLMDEALPEDEIARIQANVTEHLGEALQAHDLRTRRAGPRTFIQFHLVVPAEMSVRTSHAICDSIEQSLEEAFGSVLVSIHVEPDHEAETGAFATPE